MSRETLGKILLAASLVSLGWAVVLLLTGGFRIATPVVRITSSDPSRPLVLGLACAAAVWYLAPHLGVAFFRRAEPIVERRSPAVALVAAVAIVLVGVKCATFSA